MKKTVQSGQGYKVHEAERKAKRKAELDAMPRCAICKRRGNWRVGNGDRRVLLCGRHLKQAQAKAQQFGLLS